MYLPIKVDAFPADRRSVRCSNRPKSAGSAFIPFYIIRKGTRVRTASPLSPTRGYSRLRTARFVAFASFRAFPHEVPLAGDKIRQPRVVFAVLKLQKGQCARQRALRPSAARDPIAKHQPDFATCVLASARVFRDVGKCKRVYFYV